MRTPSLPHLARSVLLPILASWILILTPALLRAQDTSHHQASLVATDGVEIAYTESGDGEVSLVLIHGWACNQRFWREQVELLAENYRVISFDLPGHGKSGHARENWSVGGFALDVKTVVESLGLSKIILIGHSMGGPIALASYPHLVEQTVGVIAVDSLHDAERTIPKEATESWAATMEADFEGTMIQMVTGMFVESGTPELRDWVIAEANASDHAAMVALVRDYVNVDTKAWLSATKVPVRAINSAPRPPTVPETNIELNRKYSDFDAVFMEGVGHYLMLEKPEEFNALLSEVLIGLLSVEP